MSASTYIANVTIPPAAAAKNNNNNNPKAVFQKLSIEIKNDNTVEGVNSGRNISPLLASPVSPALSSPGLLVPGSANPLYRRSSDVIGLANFTNLEAENTNNNNNSAENALNASLDSPNPEIVKYLLEAPAENNDEAAIPTLAEIQELEKAELSILQQQLNPPTGETKDPSLTTFSPRLRYEQLLQKGNLDYSADGDLSLDSTDHRAQRKLLQKNKQIKQWISTFWSTYSKEIVPIDPRVYLSRNGAAKLPSTTTSSKSNSPRTNLPSDKLEGISHKEYLSVHNLMFKALHKKFSEELAGKSASRDWNRDSWLSSHGLYLDEAAHSHSLFELADLWTLTIEPLEYLHFLAVLFHRLTRLQTALDHKGQVISRYVWRNLDQVSSAAVYRPFMYNKYRQIKWKQVKQVLSKLETQQNLRNSTAIPDNNEENGEKEEEEDIFVEGIDSEWSTEENSSSSSSGEEEEELGIDFSHGNHKELSLQQKILLEKKLEFQRQMQDLQLGSGQALEIMQGNNAALKNNPENVANLSNLSNSSAEAVAPMINNPNQWSAVQSLGLDFSATSIENYKQVSEGGDKQEVNSFRGQSRDKVLQMIDHRGNQIPANNSSSSSIGKSTDNAADNSNAATTARNSTASGNSAENSSVSSPKVQSSPRTSLINNSLLMAKFQKNRTVAAAPAAGGEAHPKAAAVASSFSETALQLSPLIKIDAPEEIPLSPMSITITNEADLQLPLEAFALLNDLPEISVTPPALEMLASSHEPGIFPSPAQEQHSDSDTSLSSADSEASEGENDSSAVKLKKLRSQLKQISSIVKQRREDRKLAMVQQMKVIIESGDKAEEIFSDSQIHRKISKAKRKNQKKAGRIQGAERPKKSQRRSKQSKKLKELHSDGEAILGQSKSVRALLGSDENASPENESRAALAEKQQRYDKAKSAAKSLKVLIRQAENARKQQNKLRDFERRVKRIQDSLRAENEGEIEPPAAAAGEETLRAGNRKANLAKPREIHALNSGIDEEGQRDDINQQVEEKSGPANKFHRSKGKKVRISAEATKGVKNNKTRVIHSKNNSAAPKSLNPSRSVDSLNPALNKVKPSSSKLAALSAKTPKKSAQLPAHSPTATAASDDSNSEVDSDLDRTEFSVEERFALRAAEDLEAEEENYRQLLRQFNGDEAAVRRAWKAQQQALLAKENSQKIQADMIKQRLRRRERRKKQNFAAMRLAGKISSNSAGLSEEDESHSFLPDEHSAILNILHGIDKENGAQAVALSPQEENQLSSLRKSPPQQQKAKKTNFLPPLNTLSIPQSKSARGPEYSAETFKMPNLTIETSPNLSTLASTDNSPRNSARNSGENARISFTAATSPANARNPSGPTSFSATTSPHVISRAVAAPQQLNFAQNSSDLSSPSHISVQSTQRNWDLNSGRVIFVTNSRGEQEPLVKPSDYNDWAAYEAALRRQLLLLAETDRLKLENLLKQQRRSAFFEEKTSCAEQEKLKVQQKLEQLATQKNFRLQQKERQRLEKVARKRERELLTEQRRKHREYEQEELRRQKAEVVLAKQAARVKLHNERQHLLQFLRFQQLQQRRQKAEAVINRYNTMNSPINQRQTSQINPATVEASAIPSPGAPPPRFLPPILLVAPHSVNNSRLTSPVNRQRSLGNSQSTPQLLSGSREALLIAGNSSRIMNNSAGGPWNAEL
jgi:hypothetical protein